MEQEKACGCIIINDNKVLLVKHHQGHWGFPKGHVEENETEEETAIRETKEETNIDVEIDNSHRYTIYYEVKENVMKEAVYFIAKMKSGNLKRQESEIAVADWYDLNEAIDIITHDNLKNMYKQVLEDLKKENKI